ncbi:MAG: hypothetical protein AAFX99_29910 [Myxococcota bacterium]
MTIWPIRKKSDAEDGAPRRRRKHVWHNQSAADMLAKLNTRDELEAYSGRFKWMFLAFVLPFALVGLRT